ncbi:hypothetical protein GQ457_15G011530 [Hibiscus cannabinus]
MSIKHYFHKVKLLCWEISELDPATSIGDTKLKRIIILGLKPHFRRFVVVVQGWKTQPSLVEFKNLLASQEALDKQMGGVSLINEEDALYASKGKRNFKHRKNGLKEIATTDAEAFFAVEEEELALTATMSEKIDYDNDWIVESVVSPQNNDTEMSLQNVYHVPGVKKNLISVAQLTSSGHIVIFGPQDVKVNNNLEIKDEPLMKGRRLESIYVMSAEAAYVDKTRRNETTELWHMRLSHVSYSKLDVMMNKSMLKEFPKLEEKSKTLSKFKEFKKVAEAEVGKKICWLRIGNGGEYTSDKFANFLQEYQIRRQFTCDNTPQQNEAMATATYVVNRLPQKSKMDKKSVRCIFVGYIKQRKGWKCCDPTAGKCYVSRNVVFDKASSWWSLDKESFPDSDTLKRDLQSSQVQLKLNETKIVDDDVEDCVTQNPWQIGAHQQPTIDGEPSAIEVPAPLRRSTRIKKPNPKYANVAIVEKGDAKDPETFEEASQKNNGLKQ